MNDQENWYSRQKTDVQVSVHAGVTKIEFSLIDSVVITHSRYHQLLDAESAMGILPEGILIEVTGDNGKIRGLVLPPETTFNDLYRIFDSLFHKRDENSYVGSEWRPWIKDINGTLWANRSDYTLKEFATTGIARFQTNKRVLHLYWSWARTT